jgi:hypothetical protein
MSDDRNADANDIVSPMTLYHPRLTGGMPKYSPSSDLTQRSKNNQSTVRDSESKLIVPAPGR